MIAPFFWLSLIFVFQVKPTDNPVLQTLLDRGVEANGVSVALPAPTLADGRDAIESRAVLRTVAGDDRGVENLVRDSLTAPFVLKTRDVKAGDATIRVADLWFVVRADLNEIDLKQTLGKADGSTVEAGNMRFTSKLLTAKELGDRNLDRLPEQPGRDEWYTAQAGRLLDRINVESTDRVVATRTVDSLTVAAATARSFNADSAYPNRWSAVSPGGAVEKKSSPTVYPGGGSYVKITRLLAEPGTLFVEAHFAFVEPDPWFSGNPILRSKFSLICQDQVRRLRREIQKRRTGK